MNERVFFFCGVDPAPSESHKSDDGAILATVATPRTAEGPLPSAAEDWFFDFIYGRRLTWKQKATARQWSGILHNLHRLFRFSRMCHYCQLGQKPPQCPLPPGQCPMKKSQVSGLKS
jgi:hypothetical protein